MKIPSLMETEARESADCVRRQVHTLRASITNLAASLRDNPPAFVTTCARGSSDHAALFGKYLIERALGLPVLFLIHGDRTAKDQNELARRFAAQGARAFVAAPARYAPDLPLAEGASPVATAVGMIQTFYLMAASLSVSRGNDPDNPPLLNKVTETH